VEQAELAAAVEVKEQIELVQKQEQLTLAEVEVVLIQEFQQIQEPVVQE
tara:strand:+ start:373 stop:519 length:147 start_codon:yes stop_codon:yes gene_type:complete